MEVTRLGAKAGRALTTSGLGDPPAHDPPRLESATALPILGIGPDWSRRGSPDGRTSRSSAEPRHRHPHASRDAYRRIVRRYWLVALVSPLVLFAGCTSSTQGRSPSAPTSSSVSTSA